MAGIVGKGYSLKYGTVVDTYGSTLGNCLDVSGPNISVNDIDVTTNDSTNGWMEFLPGLKDGGEVTFSMRFNKTEWAEAVGIIGVSKFWQLLLSDGSQFEWEGYIKGFGNETQYGSDVTCSCTIKVSGEPTFTAAV